MAKREPMYECLVEGCPKKFKGDFQRHWHLVNVHKYPKAFRFHFEPCSDSHVSALMASCACVVRCSRGVVHALARTHTPRR
jgi:hypothetical protein